MLTGAREGPCLGRYPLSWNSLETRGLPAWRRRFPWFLLYAYVRYTGMFTMLYKYMIIYRLCQPPRPTHNLASRSRPSQGDQPEMHVRAQLPCSAPWSGVNLFCAC